MLRLRAPAKINWTLLILGRRPDGFHEVDTVMQAVSLADELVFRPSRAPGCRIMCDDPSLPTDDSNLVARAWRLIGDAFPGRVGGVEVEIMKRIPAGAGLGGGSSDAAAALVAADRLFGLRAGRARLAEFAARIGSDVPFFLHGGAARARGRGEIVAPIPSRLPRLDLVIVHPGFASPTGPAYARLTPGDWFRAEEGADTPGDRAERALRAGRPKPLAESLANTFDEVLARHDTRYQAVKRAMEGAGLARPMLSGSGSACFAVARSAEAARRARRALLPLYPQTFAVATRRSGIAVGTK